MTDEWKLRAMVAEKEIEEAVRIRFRYSNKGFILEDSGGVFEAYLIRVKRVISKKPGRGREARRADPKPGKSCQGDDIRRQAMNRLMGEP